MAVNHRGCLHRVDHHQSGLYDLHPGGFHRESDTNIFLLGSGLHPAQILPAATVSSQGQPDGGEEQTQSRLAAVKKD